MADIGSMLIGFGLGLFLGGVLLGRMWANVADMLDAELRRANQRNDELLGDIEALGRQLRGER